MNIDIALSNTINIYPIVQNVIIKFSIKNIQYNRYKMVFNIIVATDVDNGFSKDGNIPWRLNTELQYFRKVTLNSIVVMGRKTFETLGNRPLVNRENIVISRTLVEKDGYKVYKSIPAFLQDHPVKNKASTDIYFIGGKEIYEYAIKNLEIAFIYKTVIHNNYDCDLFFPVICSYKFVNICSPVTFVEDGVMYHHEVYKSSKKRPRDY